MQSKTSQNDVLQPLLMTPEQLAVIVGYHEESIRRAIRQHRIVAVKFGKGWRIPRAEADRILREGLPV